MPYLFHHVPLPSLSPLQLLLTDLLRTFKTRCRRIVSMGAAGVALPSRFFVLPKEAETMGQPSTFAPLSLYVPPYLEEFQVCNLLVVC